MSHSTDHNQTKPAGYDWDDPHAFHEGAPVDEDGHHHEEHHVSPWQLNVVILFVLLFFTFATVLVAKGEVILTTYTDFPITQLWNVIIAMSIATVKAMLVCMYFMHLRHDKPLNTMVMLFTFATMGMFMTMPAIDVGSRGSIKPYAVGEVVPGGSGVGMARWNGEAITGSIVAQSREAKIAEVGEEEFWKKFYYYKAKYKPHKEPYRHPADETDVHAKWLAAGGAHYGHDDHGDTTAHAKAPEVSTANRRIVRAGLTPGLFDAEPYTASHSGDHAEDHANGDTDPTATDSETPAAANTSEE
ncbi:MAG: cytochrome C oxidase subunit IV family protein [Planctomycetota bacterium]